MLERDLVEWADDVELRLVWADLLQLEGDPLGRLVVLDHVAASPTTPAKVAERARAEAEALRGQLWPRLWDEVVTPDFSGITLIWALGFVRELRVDVARLSSAHTPEIRRWVPGRRRPETKQPSAADTLDWLMPRLLRQPALRWLEIIRVETPANEGSSHARWMTGANIKNPCLREIHVGGPARAQWRPGGAWEPAGHGNFSRDGLGNLRRLRWVSIDGALARVPCCEGNPQTRMHFINKLLTRPLTSSNRAALGRALFDESALVHEAAHAVARKLGPRADFLVEDLAWFLRPPLGKKDPRPAAALKTLAAIGPAGAALLPDLLASPESLVYRGRLPAFVDYLAAIGPAASSADSLLRELRDGKYGRLPPDARAALGSGGAPR